MQDLAIVQHVGSILKDLANEPNQSGGNDIAGYGWSLLVQVQNGCNLIHGMLDGFFLMTYECSGGRWRHGR